MIIFALVFAISSFVGYAMAMLGASLARAVAVIVASIFGTVLNTESQTFNVIMLICLCATIIGVCYYFWGMTGLWCAIGYLVFQAIAENDD